MRAMSTGASVAALGAVVAFVCNILMARALGASARGQVAFVLQSAYFISPMIMLGVDRTLLRSDSQRDQQAARRHLVVMTLLVGLVLALLFRDLRALAAPIAYALCWMSLARSASLRDNAYASYLRMVVAYQAFVLVTSAVLYLVGTDNWLVWLVPYVAPALLIAVYDLATDYRGRLRRVFDGVTRISLKVLPSTIATTVMLRAERVIMPLASSDAQLGMYVAVATATEVLAWLANALADNRVARLGGAATRKVGDLLRILLRDALRFLLLAAGIGAATYWLLIPVLGSTFENARVLVLPLCLAAIVLALHRQVSAWQLAGHHPAGVTISTGLSAVLAIPIYIWAILQAGALGAAWACLVVYSIALVGGIILAAMEGRRDALDQ